MQTTVVEVAYVNEPQGNRKTGSIKDVAGNYFDVWPSLLAQFQPGGKYEIEFTDRQYQGKTYHTVKTVKEVGGPAPQAVNQVPTSKPNGGFYRETSQRDAERMFVCALVVAAIKSGNLTVDSPHIKGAVNSLRKVWSETFGADDNG